jgi:hypothetical protein
MLIIKPKEELPAQEEFLQMLSSFDKAFQETKQHGKWKE